MYNRLLIAVTGFLLAGAFTTAAAADVEAGKQKHMEVCAACHGEAGISGFDQWPSLAGQTADYVRHHLALFRAEERYDPNMLMTGNAAALTDEDIENLAAFYASLEPVPLEADPELAERGRLIYHAGLPEEGVAACAACHGPAGEGVPGALFPRVGGQHAAYMVASLVGFQSGERDSDRNRMMRDIAQRMSEEDIQAVASYMSGLH